jgi:hypothetical protein
MTFADFHRDGTQPSWIEALNMDANGRHNNEEFSRRNQDVISSGPAAEKDLTDCNAFSVSSTEM